MPTVIEELLFHTGAPELVVKYGELFALDGRNYTNNQHQNQYQKPRKKKSIKNQLRINLGIKWCEESTL